VVDKSLPELAALISMVKTTIVTSDRVTGVTVTHYFVCPSLIAQTNEILAFAM